ncbi:MAG: hypothetical protein ACTSRI_12125 [Promethearchaeota archaeon]
MEIKAGPRRYASLRRNFLRFEPPTFCFLHVWHVGGIKKLKKIYSINEDTGEKRDIPENYILKEFINI